MAAAREHLLCFDALQSVENKTKHWQDAVPTTIKHQTQNETNKRVVQGAETKLRSRNPTQDLLSQPEWIDWHGDTRPLGPQVYLKEHVTRCTLYNDDNATVAKKDWVWSMRPCVRYIA